MQLWNYCDIPLGIWCDPLIQEQWTLNLGGYSPYHNGIHLRAKAFYPIIWKV